MKEQKDNVSWYAALYLWWGEVWRIAAVDISLILLVQIACKWTPIAHKILTELVINYEGTTLLALLAFQFYLHMWAIRESFTDRYVSFTFAAESKAKKRSVFAFDKRLHWSFVVAIWWAQTWRMLLIPAAIVAGGLASTLSQHPTAANYVSLLNTNLTKLNLYAAFVLSIWATKASLGDRYATFRFVSTPKTFYDGASGKPPV